MSSTPAPADANCAQARCLSVGAFEFTTRNAQSINKKSKFAMFFKCYFRHLLKTPYFYIVFDTCWRKLCAGVIGVITVAKELLLNIRYGSKGGPLRHNFLEQLFFPRRVGPVYLYRSWEIVYRIHYRIHTGSNPDPGLFILIRPFTTCIIARRVATFHPDPPRPLTLI